jgi:hypothetical protein
MEFPGVGADQIHVQLVKDAQWKARAQQWIVESPDARVLLRTLEKTKRHLVWNLAAEATKFGK